MIIIIVSPPFLLNYKNNKWNSYLFRISNALFFQHPPFWLS